MKKLPLAVATAALTPQTIAVIVVVVAGTYLVRKAINNHYRVQGKWGNKEITFEPCN